MKTLSFHTMIDIMDSHGLDFTSEGTYRGRLAFQFYRRSGRDITLSELRDIFSTYECHVYMGFKQYAPEIKFFIVVV